MKFKEIIIYILGMAVLATGLCLSTKLNLGSSALVALPFAISDIYNLNFGNVTLVYYLILIIIQIILHIIMKKYKSIIGDILQIVVSFLLTRVLNILNNLIPLIGNIYLRIIFLLVAIILIGIGASLAIKTKYPPNPTNGLIKTLSEFTRKNVGTIKNIIDITFVLITVIFSYIVSKKVVGVGIGTIIAMLGVGRVMYYFNKTLGKKIDIILEKA